jgi:rhodanese-related sulfurtransferase
MRSFLLCLLLSLSQCPGVGLAGFAPASSSPLQTKPLEKTSVPKNRSLVLVHEKYTDVTVQRGCKALKLSGFKKVWILRGRLASWALNKSPIQGDL